MRMEVPYIDGGFLNVNAYPAGALHTHTVLGHGMMNCFLRCGGTDRRMGMGA